MKKQLKNRVLSTLLPGEDVESIVVITGARQTGKTTLARTMYSHLRYINFDAPEERSIAHDVPSALWHSTVGPAVLDEVQKEPVIFEKVKYAFDAGKLPRSVLLGSSQILLLKNVRESLAGRTELYELFPLLLCEIKEGGYQSPPLIHQLCSGTSVAKLCKEISPVLLGEDNAILGAAEEELLAWGGMPALLGRKVASRWKWLRDYAHTYLERDLGDLARLHDLTPFRRFQRLAALRSGQLINYASLARDADVSPDVARRYLEYLNLSYQTVLLEPFYRNLTSTLVKSPKLYWLDCGLLRQMSGVKEGITGSIYKTMVVAEIIKWIRTCQLDTRPYFYRTRSGMEVDLLLQTSQGIIGCEIKSRTSVVPSDARALRELARALGDSWRGGIILYRGQTIKKICDPDIFAIPSRRLLG